MGRKLRKIFFKIKLFFWVSLIIFFVGFIAFIIQFEKHFIPTAVTLAEKYATNVISVEINESVQEVIGSFDLSRAKFFDGNFSADNERNYINVNNILINDICSKISNNLSKRLSDVKNNRFKLNLGGLTGIESFSNIGPRLDVFINSMGQATVDYETKFEAVGINQINFQVWLEINTQVGIINSLYSKEINVKRRLMLINTVFNGTVPETYLNTKN